MKRIMMTLAAVLCCATILLAEPVSPSMARQRAAHFLQSKGSQLKNEALRAPRRAMGSTASGETATESSPYYVFNAAGDKGFVVISGEDCVGFNLVLGYSDQGSFNADAIPANMQWWFDEMASQIADMSSQGVKARAVELHADVPYLVTALWNQGSNVYNAQNPYNALCPVTDGLSDHRRDARLDDTGFLARYGFERIAQVLAVFQSDVGDDAQDRCDHVGRIETAAQAGLDDGYVHGLFRKESERHSGRDFEERRFVLLEETVPAIDEILDKILRDHPESIAFHDLHPLAEIHQMGRRVEADLQAAGGQAGRQHMAGRTFPVGSGNMNAPETPMRMSEHLVESLHRLNPRLIRHLPHLLIGRKLIEQPLDLFFVRFHTIVVMNRISARQV